MGQVGVCVYLIHFHYEDKRVARVIGSRASGYTFTPWITFGSVNMHPNTCYGGLELFDKNTECNTMKWQKNQVVSCMGWGKCACCNISFQLQNNMIACGETRAKGKES